MPSNAELTEQVEALAEELGTTVETEGLNNGQLAALVKDLREHKGRLADTMALAEELDYPVADLADLSVEDLGGALEWLRAVKAQRDAEQAEGDPLKAAEIARANAKAAREEAAAEANKKPPYYVAPRKALTSKKGILSGDTADEVKPEYLEGGKEAFDAFLKSKHILRGD